MGHDSVELTVPYFGNWKCPYCARFSQRELPALVAEYVEPGRIAIEYRNLTYVGGEPFLGPDAPAAARAGLAVWNADPDGYWAYHRYVMHNQPPERRSWATADRLVSFAEAAGVERPSVIRSAIEAGRYRDALRDTTAAANEAGVTGTPTLVVDGQPVSPFDRERTRTLIEDALE